MLKYDKLFTNILERNFQWVDIIQFYPLQRWPDNIRKEAINK